MESKSCPECGDVLKIVPAGISKKTGKPYRAFMACPNKNCGFTSRIEGDLETEQIRSNSQGSSPDIEETVNKMRDWAKKTTELMRDLQYKIINLEDLCAEQNKRIIEVEMKIRAQSTLFVDLRGQEAVDLHESMTGEPGGVIHPKKEDDEIPIVGQ